MKYIYIYNNFCTAPGKRSDTLLRMCACVQAFDLQCTTVAKSYVSPFFNNPTKEFATVTFLAPDFFQLRQVTQIQLSATFISKEILINTAVISLIRWKGHKKSSKVNELLLFRKTLIARYLFPECGQQHVVGGG